MSEKNKADQKISNLDDSFENITNKKALKNMIEAGRILPSLKPKLDTVYRLELTGNIDTFESDYGKAFALEVKHNGILKQVNFNPEGSFHLQLLAELERANLKLSDTKGKFIIIQKTLGNTKKYKDVELFSVQLE